MARPSTYDDSKDYAKMAEDYLQTCGREQTKLPKVSEFCREWIKADEETVVERWLKGEQTPEGINPESIEQLRGAIKRVKKAQAEQLMDDGIYGGKEVNSTMAIFLLKANHGLIETDRHLVETKGSMIDIDDDGETKVQSVSTVPAKTN